MKDISRKSTTLRTATATATLRLSAATIEKINEGRVPKGNPLEVARVAAIQAAKNTSRIIPFCHSISLDAVNIDFTIGDKQVDIQTTVKAIHKTGVEMEALTAASVAALTLYDMLKPLDTSMEIAGIRLTAKTGGKSDFTESFDTPPRAAVLVISDSVAAGTNEDRSGKHIVERLTTAGLEVADYKIVPDQLEKIRKELTGYADDRRLDLVITTGGTGVGARDCTPETMEGIIDLEVPGISEAARAFGQDRTPYAMLSRGRAGIRGKTLIVNLPGSQKGVAESLDVLLPGVLHALKLLAGGNHPDRSPDKGTSPS